MKTNNYVDFANFNYSYFEFQQQYRLLCQEISMMKRSSFIKLNNNPIKRVSAILKEYRVFVKNIDNKKYFDKVILDLQEDVSNNTEFNKLSITKNKDTKEQIKYNKYYYSYLIRLFEIIGKFGDELSSTFMPTKNDRKKLLRYQNTNTFFEQFTKYKSETSKALAEFSISNFKDKFVYLLGFYYGYYSYVDFGSRLLCEDTLNKIINIYLSEDICQPLIDGFKSMSPIKKKEIKDIDLLFHNSLTCVFSKMNVSYSNYGIIPKIEEKIKFDYTLM